MTAYLGEGFLQALFDSGAIRERPETVRQVVLDFKVGTVAVMHIVKFADEHLMEVVGDGVSLKVVEEPEDAERGLHVRSAS